MHGGQGSTLAIILHLVFLDKDHHWDLGLTKSARAPKDLPVPTSPELKYKLYLTNAYLSLLSTCMHAHYILLKILKGFGSPGAGATGGCELLCESPARAASVLNHWLISPVHLSTATEQEL